MKKNEKQNTTDQQKMEKEIKHLEEKVHKLQKTNTDLTNQISNLQFQNALLEDKYKGEKQSHETTRSNFRITNESRLKEDQYLEMKLESKNRQIEELETSLNRLRKMLDQKEEDIYKMKLHIGSVADTEAGTFTESQKITRKVETSQNSRNQAEEPIQEKRKTTKTSLVVIGTSNIKHIEPQRWSKYTTRKITAYTIEDAINAIGTLKEKADVVVFHSLTNDIKHMTPDECTTKMLDLLEKTKNKSPDTKIIISLATPRSDREEWNIKQELVNAMLKQNLR
jgi:chromosome segregation ATPase